MTGNLGGRFGGGSKWDRADRFLRPERVVSPEVDIVHSPSSSTEAPIFVGDRISLVCLGRSDHKQFWKHITAIGRIN